MTREQKIIKNKPRLLRLAETLGSFSSGLQGYAVPEGQLLTFRAVV